MELPLLIPQSLSHSPGCLPIPRLNSHEAPPSWCVPSLRGWEWVWTDMLLSSHGTTVSGARRLTPIETLPFQGSEGIRVLAGPVVCSRLGWTHRPGPFHPLPTLPGTHLPFPNASLWSLAPAPDTRAMPCRDYLTGFRTAGVKAWVLELPYALRGPFCKK